MMRRFAPLLATVVLASFGTTHAQSGEQIPFFKQKIGVEYPQTPNNIAARKLFDASQYGCPTSQDCASPSLEQCRSDLKAWDQANSDWKSRLEKAHCQGCSLQYPSPIELLSTEELYRRRAEASLCGSAFSQAGLKAAKDTTVSPSNRREQWENALLDQLDMRGQEADLLKESLSRTEHVIDSHFLWEELLSKGYK
jgi:hypothetical protein